MKTIKNIAKGLTKSALDHMSKSTPTVVEQASKAISKKSVKTRNGGRKTISKEIVPAKPISIDKFNKETKVSSQRSDYKAKPIEMGNKSKPKQFKDEYRQMGKPKGR